MSNSAYVAPKLKQPLGEIVLMSKSEMMALAVPEPDPVKQPAHYTAGKIEVIDFIEQVSKNYPPEIIHHIATAIKYLARAPLKGALDQDLAKAAQYLNRARNLRDGKAEW